MGTLLLVITLIAHAVVWFVVGYKYNTFYNNRKKQKMSLEQEIIGLLENHKDARLIKVDRETFMKDQHKDQGKKTLH